MSEPFKCPYCQRMGNDHEKWQTQHMPTCRATWIKERQTAGRELNDAEQKALRDQDISLEAD